MNKISKGNIATVMMIIATLVLAGVAVFTALRLYDLRSQSVTPSTPESEPEAALPVEPVISRACTELTFSITSLTSTPTPTGEPTSTLTPTDGPTSTLTPTNAPTSTLTPTDGPTSTPGATSTPGPTSTPGSTSTPGPTSEITSTPTPTTSTVTADLPEAGFGFPTIFVMIVGAIVASLAIVLAV